MMRRGEAKNRVSCRLGEIGRVGHCSDTSARLLRAVLKYNSVHITSAASVGHSVAAGVDADLDVDVELGVLVQHGASAKFRATGYSHSAAQAAVNTRVK
jgi:hypothetical protein